MLSIGSLRNALSTERLSAYAVPEDTDEVDSVARYLWNLALCSALQPALHTLEVTVRNHLFTVSRRIVDESALSFDSIPSLDQPRPGDDTEGTLAAARSIRQGRSRFPRSGRGNHQVM